MTTRKCENWLKTFRDFSMPRTESPEVFVAWTGLFVLSAALRRRVNIPADGILGGWSCPPHLYVMLVGPPGMRKTTAMVKFGIPLLEGVVPELAQGPTFVTKEALTTQLIASDDSSIYLTIEEFGDIMQKNGPEMYDFFTSMFDGKRKIESRTVSRGIEFAEKPCINMLAATTPQWISSNMPAAAIGGGFASRVIFVYADKLSRKQMYYRQLDFDALNALEADLIHDLNHIALNLQGDFDLSEEAFEFMENWYQNVHPEIAPDPKLAGYWQRKPTHIHKIAMLHSVATKDELILTKEDFEFAIWALGTTEPNLKKVFGGVGQNEYTYSMQEIAEFVKEAGKVSQRDLLSLFQASAAPAKLLELIQGCIMMGEFEQAQNEKGEVYYFITGTTSE